VDIGAAYVAFPYSESRIPHSLLRIRTVFCILIAAATPILVAIRFVSIFFIYLFRFFYFSILFFFQLCQVSVSVAITWRT